MRTLALFPALCLAACRGGESHPKSLKECLLRAASQSSADAMAMARDICREVFPAEELADGVPIGSWYFANVTGSCSELAVGPEGALAPGRTGFCEQGSKVERLTTGALQLTCVSPSFAERTVVFDLVRDADGLEARGAAASPIRLHRYMATCERSISDSDRALSQGFRRRTKDSLDEMLLQADLAFPMSVYKAARHQLLGVDPDAGAMRAD